MKRANLLLIGIVFLAAFLRLYRLEATFDFHGELGDNFLDIKNAILYRRLPLLGPPTSHPWLSFGPLYYWVMIPLTIIFNFNPLISVYLGAVVGILTVVFNFLVIRKLFGEKVAYFSSFLMAISPLFVRFARGGRFMFFVPMLFYPFLWSLFQIWQEKRQFLFWLGLIYGTMLSFHLSPLGLMPAILIVLWQKRQSINKKGLVLGFLGFLLPNLPFFIHDLFHQLEMTTKLLIWGPYRLAGFLGLYPKNNLTREVAKQTLGKFYQFIASSFIPEKEKVGIFLTLIVVVFFLLRWKRGWFFLGWATLFCLAALFIHTDPPLHYFVPIFPLPIIVLSLFLELLWTSSWGRMAVVILVLTISFLNFRFFFSSKFFYKPPPVPFSLQKKLVRWIVEDAQGQPYNLARLGPFDYFEKNFAQNYWYLAWWFGHEPTEEKVELRYTIKERQ